MCVLSNWKTVSEVVFIIQNFYFQYKHEAPYFWEAHPWWKSNIDFNYFNQKQNLMLNQHK